MIITVVIIITINTRNDKIMTQDSQSYVRYNNSFFLFTANQLYICDKVDHSDKIIQKK